MMVHLSVKISGEKGRFGVMAMGEGKASRWMCDRASFASKRVLLSKIQASSDNIKTLGQEVLSCG